MAKLKQALARFQAQNAVVQDKVKKAKNHEKMKEQKRAAQAVRTRTAQKAKLSWLPFNDLPDDTIYLLIGEGDFSFAANFVDKYPINRIVATSLDSEEEINEKYPEKAAQNIDKVKEAGNEVFHNIDCTQLLKNKYFKQLGAHRSNGLTVVFNFPHLGNSVADQDRNIRQHQQLLLNFFTQCKQIGAVHVIITLFDGMPYEAWQPKQLARSAGYSLERTGKFPWDEFPNYDHQLTAKTGKTHKQQKLREARIYYWTNQQESSKGNKQKSNKEEPKVSSKQTPKKNKDDVSDSDSDSE